MGESFNLEDIEQREIEQATQVPNTGNITVCSCRSVVLDNPCQPMGLRWPSRQSDCLSPLRSRVRIKNCKRK